MTADFEPALDLPAVVRDRVCGWARRAYPLEACGLLLGRRGPGGTEVARATRARNAAASPRARYEVPARAWCAADRAAARRGLEVVGVWHSHPGGEPIPSRLDASGAWTEYDYVIAGVAASGRVALRAWRMAGGAFYEQTMRDESNHELA